MQKSTIVVAGFLLNKASLARPMWIEALLELRVSFRDLFAGKLQ